MRAFKDYARYYDLLYRDKDYASEAEFVHQLIQKHAPGARSILELGCGSGVHAQYLAKLGYRIHGVDMSTEMLEYAEERRIGMDRDQSERISFVQGNIHNINLGRNFDAVIALFHVMSYQPSNSDLKDSFATAKNHLIKDGVFIFDYWYGPAVLTNLPHIRVKRVEDNYIDITRIAEPFMHPNENLVEVNYQIFVKDKTKETVQVFRETHRLRYLFKPELELFFAEAGLKHLECCEWNTGRVPGFDSWNVFSIGKK